MPRQSECEKLGLWRDIDISSNFTGLSFFSGEIRSFLQHLTQIQVEMS